MPDNNPQKSEEALYLLDNNLYLHLQETDGGYDFTLYESSSLRLVDGGLMDWDTISQSPVKEPIAAARTAIFELLGLKPERVTFQDLGILEEIHAAQVRYADIAIEKFMVDYLADTSRLVPDPTISIRQMNAYGYREADMYPLSEDRAKELAEYGIPVFQLFENCTKFPIDDPNDITLFGGIYGIERHVWELSRGKLPPRDIEKRFLQRNEPMMAIYQLKDTADVDLHFRHFDRLDNPPRHEDYNCVYIRETHPEMPINALLEQQFQIYNMDRPADFTGHSMSVSDIVGIRRNGELSFHYCDSFGFKELKQFLPENYLKSAEMSMEDDYGMIDGIINNGKSQLEKKDSLREQLKIPGEKPNKVNLKKKNKEKPSL